MIELRFVKRQVPNTHDEGGNVETVRIERVLQFRQAHHYLAADGGVNPIIVSHTPVTFQWTEWKDVPVVDELLRASGEGPSE